MATKKKFLAKHGLAVNTETGSTATLNYPTEDGNANQFMKQFSNQKREEEIEKAVINKYFDITN